MLFTLTVAAAASQALSLRPAFTASARSAHFAKLRDLANVVRSDPSSSVTALHEVAGVVNEILVQEGNATEHLSDGDDGDKATLREVIRILKENMYGSMDSAQAMDLSRLADGIAAINRCSQDWTHRIEEGDLYTLRGQAISYQNDLNELQADVDDKTLTNATAWHNLATHISLISDAPVCQGFPAPRTMPALDSYFESSEYVDWYTDQKAAYWPVREAFREADRQLRVSLAAYAVGLGVRDQAYCDWRRELELGCAEYTECYRSTRAAYENHIQPSVNDNMLARIENYKAGETIIHQIRFLLAEAADQETPPIDTSPYQISPWPEIPAFTECDLSPLHDDMWVPTPECHDMCDENVNRGHRQDGYRGCQTRTRSGHLCREWPQHWIENSRFQGMGLGEHNFCRNPDHEPDGIWCYKVAGGWEYCNPHGGNQASAECRPGQDIVAGTFGHFDQDRESASDQECNERCHATAHCTSWVRPIGAGPLGTGMCWIGNQEAPQWEADNTRISGRGRCAMPEAFVDLGLGCCAPEEERRTLFSNWLGDLDACKAKCKEFDDCAFIVHGWDNGAGRWCGVFGGNSSCNVRNTGHNDCGSRGNTGVRSYRFTGR